MHLNLVVVFPTESNNHKIGLTESNVSLGIGGEKCDQCDRGFYQQAERSIQHPVLSRIIPPGETQQCQECGECFSRYL